MAGRDFCLRTITQHQLLGVGMLIHLLVHPVGNWMPVQGRPVRACALAEAAATPGGRLLQLLQNEVRLRRVLTGQAAYREAQRRQAKAIWLSPQ